MHRNQVLKQKQPELERGTEIETESTMQPKDPGYIPSPELAAFLDIPEDTLVDKVQVWLQVDKYIKDNHLVDGKLFKLDNKLKSIIPDDPSKRKEIVDKRRPTRYAGELAYFYLGILLDPHFTKM